jgi:hypothetical protein
MGQLAEPAIQIGCASFLFPDTERHLAPRSYRVRIAGWSSGDKLPMKRKRDKNRKRQRHLLMKEKKMN